jgi:hypothetical protein
MSILTPPPRLASASVVFFAPHGQITQHAQQRGVSRQRLYREADSVLRDLDPTPARQQIASLRQKLSQLQERLQRLQDRQLRAVLITHQLQAEFAGTAQAEGVSLPVARRLLSVFLRDRTPSVAQLGRYSRRAGLQAGRLLEVLDQHAKSRIHHAAADEIFFGTKPVLMVVEPESLCWQTGRLSANRDGETWAKELQQLPALEHLVRDGGSGLANGVARVNAQRCEKPGKEITEQLDHFHTLREGQRALRKTQARAERAWTEAEKADQKVSRQDRQGKALSGYATQAALKWQQAEQAFHQWEQAEQALQQIHQALQPFTPQGELNSRERAVQEVEAALPHLPGEEYAKFHRQLRRWETYTYLDRLQGRLEALEVAPEVREAVVGREGVRAHPELVQGEGTQPAVMRGLFLVWGMLIAGAGEAGQLAVATARQALCCVGRASSCVEGVNSVVRMQQGRHRKMTQSLLDLKRLNWNLRKFRTGRRKQTSPYERLGLALPPDLSWWQLLQWTPEQLGTHLSAQSMAA